MEKKQAFNPYLPDRIFVSMTMCAGQPRWTIWPDGKPYGETKGEVNLFDSAVRHRTGCNTAA